MHCNLVVTDTSLHSLLAPTDLESREYHQRNLKTSEQRFRLLWLRLRLSLRLRIWLRLSEKKLINEK
jgi:hypothetical protein